MVDTTDPRALGEELTAVMRFGVEDDVTIPFALAVRIHDTLVSQSSSTGEVTQYEVCPSCGGVGAVSDGVNSATCQKCVGQGRIEVARHRFASPQTAGEVGELVERLRNMLMNGTPRCVAQAADTITSLTAERDALKHDLERQMTVANEECMRAEEALARCEEMRGALERAGAVLRDYIIGSGDVDDADRELLTLISAALGDGGGG